MNNFVYLAHHGIKGQKWGVRRFQNEDGSLTSAGKSRYSGSRLGALKNYMSERRGNVSKFYKRAGGAEDKVPEERTAKEQARYDKAEKQYKKDQAAAKAHLKKNLSDIKENKRLKKENRRFEKDMNRMKKLADRVMSTFNDAQILTDATGAVYVRGINASKYNRLSAKYNREVDKLYKKYGTKRVDDILGM